MNKLSEKLAEELAVATSTRERLGGKLAQSAVTRTESRSLMALVEAIANAEGRESAYTRMKAAASYAEANGEDAKAMAQKEALGMLEQGADDEWSGRGNDVRRARFDGVREAVRDVRFL